MTAPVPVAVGVALLQFVMLSASRVRFPDPAEMFCALAKSIEGARSERSAFDVPAAPPSKVMPVPLSTASDEDAVAFPIVTAPVFFEPMLIFFAPAAIKSRRSRERSPDADAAAPMPMAWPAVAVSIFTSPPALVMRSVSVPGSVTWSTARSIAPPVASIFVPEARSSVPVLTLRSSAFVPVP